MATLDSRITILEHGAITTEAVLGSIKDLTEEIRNLSIRHTERLDALEIEQASNKLLVGLLNTGVKDIKKWLFWGITSIVVILAGFFIWFIQQVSMLAASFLVQ